MRKMTRVLLAALIPGLFFSPPASAVELEDIDIPYEQFTLENGLRVIVHTDRKVPIVAMKTWYHVGSKDEPEGKTGFAHLFEHLMFQGSENYDDEYFKPLREVGARGINGTTSVDRTSYYQTVPTEALERMLWLESDRMTHLLGAIDQEKLDEQREVVKNEKRDGENRPFGKLWERLYRGVFPPGHPYRHQVIGAMDDLNAATLDDVYDWFKTWYGASNVVVVLSGDTDLATARPLMEKYYGDAPAGAPAARLTEWVPRLTENRREIMYDRAASGFIRRVWPTPSTPKESVGLSLWGDAFAAGRTAPLYQALVEEHRLASSVSASHTWFEISGLFTVGVSLLPGADADEASRVLDQTMAEFLASGPPPERLERLRTQELTSWVRWLESASAKASELISGAVYEDDPEHYKKNIAAVQEATPADLAELAETWLTRPYYQLTGLPLPSYASADAGADRSALPTPGPATQLRLTEVSERELDNGIKVVLARREGLPVTDLAFRFDLGVADESPEDRGLTRMSFQQLHTGTSSRNAAQISAELERLGSYVSSGAGMLASWVSTGGLTEKLPEIIPLVADLLHNPTYPEDQFTLAADRWAASIARSRTRPNSVAYAALQEQVYGAEHPYGWRMTEADVRRMSRRDAMDYYQAYIRDHRFTVVAVGDVTMDRLAELLSDAFAGWGGDSANGPAPVVTPAAVAQEPRLFFIDMPGTEQTVITAGHPVPPTTVAPDVANRIANEILGGGFVSRINLNLREDKGWSYGAGTGLEADRFQPMFSISAPVQADKTAEAIAELQRELAEYIDGNPATLAEFTQARERNLRSLAGRLETNRALRGELLSSIYMGRPWHYLALFDEAMRELTLDETRTAARELIHPERLTWVIVGDLAQFEDDVRALGIGTAAVLDVYGKPVGPDMGT